MTPVQGAYNLSGLFAVSWLLAAVWTRRAVRRPVFGTQTAYLVFFALGVGMIFSGREGIDGETPMLSSPWPEALGWLWVLVVTAGFGFCWWARIHLGSMWSASVSAKAGQKIVDTGPYGLVRHPIYTGMIGAGLALAILKLDYVSFAGVAVLTLSFWIKARMEEQILREELGTEAYDAYAARTPMLIPKIWR